MKYPYMALPDETEITHFDIQVIDGIENITVYIEQPINGGFASTYCNLPL